MTEACPVCDGSGYILFAPPHVETEVRCGACFGDGVLEVDGRGHWRRHQDVVELQYCGRDEWKRLPVADELFGDRTAPAYQDAEPVAGP